MNKSLIFIIIAIIIVVGAWFLFAPNVNKENQIRNADMLGSDEAVLVAASDVEYFENAKGYFAQPKVSGDYPGIVMIHENRGLRPEIKTMAVQLAREGYMVLAVDLFEGQVLETQDEARAVTQNFDQQKGVENMRAAVAFLKERGATKIASLGWCFGGRQSLALGTSGEQLDATIVYYGGGMPTTTSALAPIKWPVLGIFGDADQAIPVSMVNDFENSLNTLGIENEIYIYPGVGHAFANPSGMNYAPNETKDAWKKTVAFLEKHLDE